MDDLFLAKNVELLVRRTSLRLRGSCSELEIDVPADVDAGAIAGLLNSGAPLTRLYEPQMLRREHAAEIAQALHAEGMLAKPIAPEPQPALANIHIPFRSRIVVVGLCDLGLQLLAALSGRVSDLAIADFKRVHYADTGPFYSSSDIGVMRRVAAGRHLQKLAPAVRMLQDQDALISEAAAADMVLLVQSQLEAQLCLSMARGPCKRLLLLLPRHDRKVVYSQAGEPSSCIECAIRHLLNRDLYAAQRHELEWRHRCTGAESAGMLEYALGVGFGHPPRAASRTTALDIRANKAVDVVPHPACHRCGDAIRKARSRKPSVSFGNSDAATEADISRLYANGMRLVDVNEGLISHVADSQLSTSQLELWSARGARSAECAVAACKVSVACIPYGAEIDRYITGIGAHENDQTTARALAIAECLERACASVYAPGAEYIAARARELPSDAIDLESWRPYAEAQYLQPSFPCRRYKAEDACDWIEATRLSDARPVLIPIDFAFLQEGRPLFLPTGSGAAAYSNFSGAAANAICEIIERDSLLLCWMNQISPPVIEEGQSLILGNSLLSSLTRLGFNISLRDATTEIGVPMLMAIVSDTRNEAFFWMNVATGGSPEEAAGRIGREFVIQWRHYFSSTPPSPALGASFDVNKISSLQDHLDFYQSAEKRKLTDFLTPRSCRSLAQMRWRTFSSKAAHLDWLVGCLLDASLDAYVVDCSHPTVAELGFRIVKAIIPEMLTLHVGPGTCPLGGRRAARAGLDSAGGRADIGSMNTWPHPFY